MTIRFKTALTVAAIAGLSLTGPAVAATAADTTPSPLLHAIDDPGSPTDPVDPEEPTDPEEPVDPVDPEDPTDPDPDEPVDPADPGDPVPPVEPAEQPEDPGVSGTSGNDSGSDDEGTDEEPGNRLAETGPELSGLLAASGSLLGGGTGAVLYARQRLRTARAKHRARSGR